MPYTVEQKIKLLVLWDILCRNTDEAHALNTDEIIEMLAEKGINVGRKVLVQYIDLLNRYGYEVMSYKKKYHYYYVVSRVFDIAEIAMLADVVKASKLTRTILTMRSNVPKFSAVSVIAISCRLTLSRIRNSA